MDGDRASLDVDRLRLAEICDRYGIGGLGLFGSFAQRFWRKRRRFMRHDLALAIAAASISWLAILAPAVPASAASTPAPPPPDIQKMLDGPALLEVQQLAKDARDADATAAAQPGAVPGENDGQNAQEPDFSGARIASVHEVFMFSLGFDAGRTSGDPITATGEWMAGLERGSQPLGTMMVDKTAAGAVEVGGFNSDVDCATALRAVKPNESFILDERTEELFALLGTTVRPLNARARAELPSAAPISTLRTLVATRIAAGNKADAGIDAPVSGGGPGAEADAGSDHALSNPIMLLGLGLAASAGAASLYLFRARRGRAQG